MLLVIAVVAPAILLGLTLFFQAYRYERVAAGAALQNTARALAGMVDSQVAEADMILKAFAATGAIRRGDLRTLDATARETLQSDERWFLLLDPKGQQLLNTQLPDGAALPRVSLEPDFVAAMAGGQRYVSNLRDGPVAQFDVVHVSRPFMESGKLKYSLSLVMMPGAMGRTLKMEGYAADFVVAVLDRNGKIIGRSRAPEKYVGHSATPDIVALTTQHAEGVVDSTTLEGIPVLTAFQRAACGWSVAVGAPQDTLYASARRLMFMGLGAAALLGLVATMMALWIGRAVVRNVDALSGDADRLGRGETLVPRPPGLAETDFVAQAMQRTGETLRQRTRTLEILNRVNAGLVAERDLEKIVQSVTDAGREVSGAAFGAFFYNVQNASGESFMLFTLSGAPREAFERFGMPRNTAVFSPTFFGTDIVRAADITIDPRYGKSGPHFGMPQGHPPVRSYLAVPVKSRNGDVIGGMIFGHPKPDVFTREAEEVVVGLAAEAAIAVDNAKLYQALSHELAAKSRAEAELKLAQQELERKVDERTASLREAVAQMEEFSYTVSHDLRSPLRAMNSYATALLEDYGATLDETAKNYVQRIARSSERMDRLTRDVLIYSRIARLHVELAPTDLDKIVRSTVEHYEELQPAVADVRVESPLLPVQAHESSLTQCLANLLTNAVKFVRAGERPQVTVRTERRDGGVRIWIEDRGIGIPPAFQGGLFRIFERAPTAGKYDGTGIGLAIVRRAVEKMGGSCGVESDGKTGSRFWIQLAAA